MAATKQVNVNRKKNAEHPEINIQAPDNSTPAYPGARFNSSGFCINHNNIRLCTVTDEDKYKILRKVCFKCGSCKLRTNSRVNSLHGSVKKVKPRCETPKGMIRATTPPGRGRRKNRLSTFRRVSGEQRRKTSKSCERSNMNKKNAAAAKKDLSSRSRSHSKEASTPTQSTRRSRSRSHTTTKNLLSPLELSGLYPPPPGRSSGRSRSKSCKRQTNDGTSKISSSKDDIQNGNNKLIRRTLSPPPPPHLSSSKSVEAKIKEITISKKAHGKIDYVELGKLVAMKDDETTLTTLPCPATPDSFRSKQAVFSIDNSDLIVELYNKKRSDDEMRSSDRCREDRLWSMTKLKPRNSTRKA